MSTWFDLETETPGDIAPGRLGDIVVDRLTRAIVDGELKPGDALPSEGQIAARFGVSKPIAREALRDLAALGVVHVQQGKVSRVRGLDARPLKRFYGIAVGTDRQGLRDAVELRRLIEPPVARLAASRRSLDDLAEFDRVLARMEAALGDVPRWIEADLAFHRHVGAMSGNRLVRFQIEALEPVIRDMMGRFNARAARGPKDWRQTFARHERVADAIRAGDPDAADAAMRRHFEAADAAIAEIFGERSL
jgi:GntR family transcriptional regulator, transcriptional repressor for pyruvate dehydrogenase complex